MINYRTRNNIKRTFENFLHQIGYGNIKVVVGMREWCYEDITQTIYVQLYNDEPIVDETFYKVCKDLGLESECPLFVLSFLHELGHYVDYNEIFESDTSLGNLPLIWSYLYEVMGYEIDANAHYIYMMGMGERVATQWAVDFVNDNEDLIEKLCDLLRECWV